MNHLMTNYFGAVKNALDTLPEDTAEGLATRIINAKGPVLICGNGGSMATAMHFACDLRSIGILAFALSSPVVLTQIMNDCGPEKVFVDQSPFGHTVIAFTGSGTSKDVERLFFNAGIDLIVITSTMKLGERVWDRHDGLGATIVEVDSSDYEVIEDVHMALCHAVKKTIRERLS